jgi:hypothetical protein
LPALALGDLETLLALFLKQKQLRKFTWLDPVIQCEQNTCTIFNLVQFNLKTRVQFYGFFFLPHLVSNDVKLHTNFFLLHLLSNDIKLHTSFQTKSSTTRYFYLPIMAHEGHEYSPFSFGNCIACPCAWGY